MAAAEGPPMTVLPQAPSNCEPGGQHALLEDADDNPLYYTDSFRMYCLKVLPCSKRYCHDWTTCPFAHPAEKAKRRDPRIYSYTGVACPEMKKNNHCPAGDKCVYAHSVWEYWLHSSRYRTQLCKDGVSCKRKICFFAHTLEELRVSSVKVLNNPEAARLGEGFELDPFAQSAPSNGSHTQGVGGRHGGGGPQRKGGHHGNRHHMAHARHGLANGSHFHSSNGIGGGHGGIFFNGQQMQGFSMADLQQLAQLQAKLQATTGMGSLGALQAQLMQQQQQQRMGGGLGPGMMPSMADPAASEHLMHQLMQQQHQQQPQQPHQQTDVMQIMVSALSSQQQQQQQQQQQAAAVAATAAMAAATHAHTPAAVTAATAHMQMLQNGGVQAPPGGMESQQQVGAGTAVAGSLNAGVMGVQGGMLTQQQQQEQHAAALAGIGGLQGGARNGMAPSLNMHNMGGCRRGNNSSSARPGLSSFANHAHRAPALGAGLPHDQQHTAPSALLAQQFAGLGINGGGLGAVAPLPPPAHTHINGNHRVPYSSSGFAAGAHGVFGGGPTFRRQRSLPPPHAAPVPIAQGAGRRSSLQLHAHPRAQQQQQQHGGGDFSLAAHALPLHTPRREGSGKLSPVLDPGAGSMIPINSTMATMPSAAVLHTAASAPGPGSRGPAAAAAAAVASSFFSNNSLSRAGSATSSTVNHLTNVESVTNAEEAVLNA